MDTTQVIWIDDEEGIVSSNHHLPGKTIKKQCNS